MSWQHKLLFALCVISGAVVGLAAYCGGPYVAAFAGWTAGFTTTLSVQAGIWLRRTIGFTFAGAFQVAVLVCDI